MRPAPAIRVAAASFISLRDSDAGDEDGQLIRLDARRTLSQDSDSALSSDWPADFDGLPAEQKERLSKVFSPLGREQHQKQKEQGRKDFRRSVNLLNTNMLQKWNHQRN